MSNANFSTPPDWYSDPQNATLDRYWDGNNWTEHTRPAQVGGIPDPMPPFQPETKNPGNGFSIAGIVCGALAFLFFPIILGPIGLILGAVAKSKGESKANIALIVSALGLVLGMVIGALLTSMMV